MFNKFENLKYATLRNTAEFERHIAHIAKMGKEEYLASKREWLIAQQEEHAAFEAVAARFQ